MGGACGKSSGDKYTAAPGSRQAWEEERKGVAQLQEQINALRNENEKLKQKQEDFDATLKERSVALTSLEAEHKKLQKSREDEVTQLNEQMDQLKLRGPAPKPISTGGVVTLYVTDVIGFLRLVRSLEGVSRYSTILMSQMGTPAGKNLSASGSTTGGDMAAVALQVADGRYFFVLMNGGMTSLMEASRNVRQTNASLRDEPFASFLPSEHSAYVQAEMKKRKVVDEMKRVSRGGALDGESADRVDPIAAPRAVRPPAAKREPSASALKKPTPIDAPKPGRQPSQIPSANTKRSATPKSEKSDKDKDKSDKSGDGRSESDGMPKSGRNSSAKKSPRPPSPTRKTSTPSADGDQGRRTPSPSPSKPTGALERDKKQQSEKNVKAGATVPSNPRKAPSNSNLKTGMKASPVAKKVAAGPPPTLVTVTELGASANIKQFGGNVAVLTTELGLSTAAPMAIGDYAMKIVKARQVLSVIWRHFGALAIETDSDEFYIVFSSAANALNAALEAHEALAALNSHLDGTQWAQRIMLTAVGIGYGAGLCQDAQSRRFYGPAYTSAQKLRFLVSEVGEVLIDRALRTGLNAGGARAPVGLKFEERFESGGRGADAAPHFCVTGRTNQGMPWELVSASINDHPVFATAGADTFVRLVNKRWELDSDAAEIDKRLRTQFVRPVTVVVYAVRVEQIRNSPIEKALGVKQAGFEIIRQWVAKFRGECLEQDLWVFDTPENALKATLAVKQAFVEHNASHAATERFSFSGFGIHTGDMISVPDTDVHWGDCVELAASFAREQATEGEIYVTEAVKAALQGKSDFSRIVYDQRKARFTNNREAIGFSVADRSSLEDFRTPLAAAPSADFGEVEGHETVRRFKGSKAVLVTDMSGFTKTTRKLGIVHFASILLKMRQLLTVVWNHYNAICIETEADDFFVVFDTAADALSAAIDAYKIVGAFNATNKSEDFRIKLGGIGIGYGDGLVQDTITKKLYGLVFDSAFRLGEDLSEGQEILIDHATWEAVNDLPRYEALDFQERYDTERGARVAHYSIAKEDHGAFTKGTCTFTMVQAELARPVHAENPEAQDFMDLILSRWDTGADTAKIDTTIRAKFLRPATVIMAGAAYRETTRKFGVEATISIKQKAFDIAKKRIEQLSGQMLEEGLWVFGRQADALRAALDIKRLFIEYNSTHPENERIPFTGFGMHCGDLLLARGTDVHWGDPVNTASKLGEDAAGDAEIFISDAVYQAVSGNSDFTRVMFDQRSVTISQVSFTYYCASERVLASVGSGKNVVTDDHSGIQRFNGEHAVIVTDMSGFTRTTRKLGIVHFASIILKMRQLLTVVWNHYNAVCIETEADDFFVVFTTAHEALAAAVQAYDILDEFNKTQSNPDFHIKVGGMGIAMGTGLIQDHVTKKLYGAPFDGAFRLGEDLSEDQEILIDNTVHEKVKNHRLFTELSYEEKIDEERNATVPHFSVSREVQRGFTKGTCGFDKVMASTRKQLKVEGGNDAKDFMRLMMSRWDEKADIPAVDAEVRTKYLRKATVVMAGFAYRETTKNYGVEQTVVVKQRAFDILRRRVEQLSGQCLEEGLWVFIESADAVRASLDVKQLFVDYNGGRPENERIPFTGFGVHSGDLLIGPGTDVHWGDPVNTASKLGEDAAGEGEIFISDIIHTAVDRMQDFANVNWEKREITISGVAFVYFSITERVLNSMKKGHHGGAAQHMVPMKDNPSIEQFVGSKVVIVTDMSGFTRTTRKLGIVHFASIILKMRQLLTVVWNHYNAICIETEADDFFVVFNSPFDALAAAIQAYNVLDDFNKTMTNPDFHIKVGGMGIAMGTDLVQDTITKKLYGAPMDNAFRLGEDLSEDQEVLIDHGCYEAVRNSQLFTELTYEEKMDEERNATVPHYSVSREVQHKFTRGTIAFDKVMKTIGKGERIEGGPEARTFMRLMLQRWEKDAPLADIDGELRTKYLRPATVVMAGAAYRETTKNYGVGQAVTVKQRAFEIVKRRVEQLNGVCLEDGLWVFSNARDAVRATLDIKQLYIEYNNKAAEKDRIPFSGFGIHSGDLLVGKGTDVHWGDPVNTASKLGEDAAGEGEIFISDIIHTAVQDSSDFVHVSYEQREITISGVAFVYYSIGERSLTTVKSHAPGSMKAMIPMEGNKHVMRFVGTKAVIVTDMSGFTRTTRKLGIVHFASIILKMRQLLTVVWNHYNSVCIETEADDFFVVFDTPNEALAAAIEAYNVLDEFNKTMTNPDFHIKVGGMGIAMGTDLIQDHVTKKLYGAPMDNAFRLGEDLSEDQEILIDHGCYEAVRGAALFNELSYEEKMDEERNATVPHYSVSREVQKGFTKSTCGFDKVMTTVKKPAKVEGGAETREFMRLILKRWDAGVDLATLDAEIRSKYLRPATVVMAGAAYREITKNYGVEQAVTVKQKAFDIVKRRVEQLNGVCLEDGLWVFGQPREALRATLDIKFLYQEYNAKREPRDRIPFSGFGIHSGDLLVGKGTDVHWGDPVNTASKLGEDAAGEGEIFISDIIHTGVEGAPDFTNVTYDQREITISGVAFRYFSVEETSRAAVGRTGSGRARSATASNAAENPFLGVKEVESPAASPRGDAAPTRTISGVLGKGSVPTVTTTAPTPVMATATSPPMKLAPVAVTAAAQPPTGAVPPVPMVTAAATPDSGLRRYGAESVVVVASYRKLARSLVSRGVIHAAGIALRLRHVVSAIWQSYSVAVVDTDDENFIGVFGNPSDALGAALQTRPLLEEYNATLPAADRESFALRLDGIAVIVGGADATYDSTQKRVFAPRLDVAMALVEDRAAETGVLLDAPLAAAVARNSLLSDMTRTDASVRDQRSATTTPVVTVTGAFRKGTCTLAVITEALKKPLRVDGGPDVRDFVRLLHRRWDTTDRPNVDEEFRTKFTRVAAVLNLVAGSPAATAAAPKARSRRTAAHNRGVVSQEGSTAVSRAMAGGAAMDTIVRPLVDKYKGVCIDEDTFVFTTNANAVNAAVELRELVRAHNAREGTSVPIPCVGIVVESATVAYVKGLDMVWMDSNAVSQAILEDEFVAPTSTDRPWIVVARAVGTSVGTSPQIKFEDRSVHIGSRDVLYSIVA